MKLTLSEAKSTLARVIGVCEDDSRVADYANEACRRLLTRGKWVGTYGRYRVCVNDGCLTWPRQIETIEAMAICDMPGVVRNEWFEFLQGGPGLTSDDNTIGLAMVDRGECCTFNDISGINKKVRVYKDVAEFVNTDILILGYDENGNWIRTDTGGGVWIDGERVVPSLTGQLTVHKFSGITGVQKPVTNGPIRLYEYDVDTAANTKALAIYEASETLPLYRRSYIPGLADMGQCCGGSSPCDNRTVTVMAKLRFIPVAEDTDYLMIGNLPAVKDMVQSILKAERNLVQEAMVYEQKAVNELQKELGSFQGDGPVLELRMQDRFTWGGGGVMNTIDSYYW